MDRLCYLCKNNKSSPTKSRSKIKEANEPPTPPNTHLQKQAFNLVTTSLGSEVSTSPNARLKPCLQTHKHPKKTNFQPRQPLRKRGFNLVQHTPRKRGSNLVTTSLGSEVSTSSTSHLRKRGFNLVQCKVKTLPPNTQTHPFGNEVSTSSNTSHGSEVSTSP